MRPVIKVENLGKKYLIHHEKPERYHTLRDAITKKISNYVWKKDSPAKEAFWALKGVDFEIKQGDRVGILGKNGAGKSTLLKILSRITEQTTGRIKMKGRIACLLEVGTGFHAELTGRENIYLNGAILGMSRQETNQKFDEIVDFSGVEKFLDTPVKKYSSGMYMRLAFAVAAHLEPEILVIDEVLSVGDMEFQKKCLNKMQSIANEGRTILFVSHNIGAVKNLCNRGIVLKKGVVSDDSSIDSAISHFLKEEKINSNYVNTRYSRKGFSFVEVFASGQNSRESRSTFEENENIVLSISFNSPREVKGGRIVLTVINEEGIVVFTSTNQLYSENTWKEGLNKTHCTIPENLLNKGAYAIQLHAGMPGFKRLIEPNNYVNIIITSKYSGSIYHEKWPGVVAPKIEWV